MSAPRRRASDQPMARRRRLRVLLGAVIVGLAMVTIVVFATVAIRASANRDNRFATTDTRIERLIARISREGVERRDQTCRLFEGQHLSEVVRLRRTYRYLKRLPRSEYGTSLTRAIVLALPAQETDARTDAAPAFCDKPHVGLPEPDPTLPAKRNFRYLLKRP